MNDEYIDPSAQLIAERVKHTINLLRADNRSLKQTHESDREFALHRLDQLEKCQQDHETRIRTSTNGVTQFKAMISLTSFIAVILSIISTLIVIFSR